MTWVGRYRSNTALVWEGSLQVHRNYGLQIKLYWLIKIPKISVFGTKEYELFFFPGIFFRYEFNSSSNQTATPGYQNDLFLSRHCKIWAKIRIFFMYTWLSNSCLHHNNVEITEMKKITAQIIQRVAMLFTRSYFLLDITWPTLYLIFGQLILGLDLQSRYFF